MTDYIRNSLTGVLAPVNNELEKIQISLSDKFDRNPSVNQSNELKRDLDANSKRIINLPLPLSGSEPARLIDLANLAGGEITITNITYDSEVRVFNDIAAMQSSALVIGNTALCKRQTVSGALVEGLVYDIRAFASVDGVIDFALANGNIAVRARTQVNNFDPTSLNSAIATNTSNIATNTTAIATNATAITNNAALVDGFTKTYWFYANDVTTTSAPISHGAASTTTYLTNDAAGTGTTSYNPDSKSALWNPTTNRFDYSSLKIGDVVEFRVDLTVVNGAAQEINVVMDVAEGTATAYTLNVNHAYYKTAGSGTPITALFRLYIGDENTRTGSARLRLISLDASTITVKGWFFQVTEV